MPNLNKVMLMGNLTRDPELRYTPNNTAVCQIGVAVNRRWRDQDGQQQEEVTFVDCEAWSKTADLINQYMRKGRPIFIEGRLKLDQWKDKEGNNRSKLKVVVENFQFVDTKADAEASASGGGQRGASAPRGGERDYAPASAPASAPPDEPHTAVGEEDIPF